MWTFMTDQNNYSSIDIVSDVIKSYNNSENCVAEFAPSEIGLKETKEIFEERSGGQEPET